MDRAAAIDQNLGVGIQGIANSVECSFLVDIKRSRMLWVELMKIRVDRINVESPEGLLGIDFVLSEGSSKKALSDAAFVSGDKGERFGDDWICVCFHRFRRAPAGRGFFSATAEGCFDLRVKWAKAMGLGAVVEAVEVRLPLLPFLFAIGRFLVGACSRIWRVKHPRPECPPLPIAGGFGDSCLRGRGVPK